MSTNLILAKTVFLTTYWTSFVSGQVSPLHNLTVLTSINPQEKSHTSLDFQLLYHKNHWLFNYKQIIHFQSRIRGQSPFRRCPLQPHSIHFFFMQSTHIKCLTLGNQADFCCHEMYYSQGMKIFYSQFPLLTQIFFPNENYLIF